MTTGRNIRILGRATRIDLLNFSTPQMRAFHTTWFALHIAFFAWFAMAPLMAVVRDDLLLTKTQIGNIIIASVALDVLARLFLGWLSGRVGPRIAYTWLLIVGSLPVMGIGLAQNYETFLLFRLSISVIGASFVVTQYHTSLMFAPNVVGTANATTAGWGNLGGGTTQMVMPLVLAALLSLGVSETLGWRLAMIVPGAALFFMGIAYYFLTRDAPEGSLRQLRAEGKLAPTLPFHESFLTVAKNYRVWVLLLLYAACFGVELTINNVAALYFHDRFGLSVTTAGFIAGLFGFMNIFARSLGGVFGDRAGMRWGLQGRVLFLGVTLFLEGLTLMLFSQMSILLLAVGAMIIFSLFTQMCEGATFSIVPFVNRRLLGPVAGIVGAGGNGGAVAAGFLFRIESLSTQQALFYLGVIVTLASSLVFLVRFSAEDEAAERQHMEQALAERSTESSPTQKAG